MKLVLAYSELFGVSFGGLPGLCEYLCNAIDSIGLLSVDGIINDQSIHPIDEPQYLASSPAMFSCFAVSFTLSIMSDMMESLMSESSRVNLILSALPRDLYAIVVTLQL